MEPRSDLVRLAQSGDTAAARSLIEKNYIAVYRLALSILDDPDQAVLAAHEAGTAQLENLDAYPGPEGYTAWLYRITLQVCRRRLRMRSIAQRLPAGLQRRLELTGYPPKEPTAEVNPYIRAAAQLDEPLRLALVLRYGHDLLPHEIGQVLDWRDSSVQARLFQARQRLRSLLNTGNPTDVPSGPETSLSHPLAEKFIEQRADHAITDEDAVRLARHLKECPRCVETGRRLEELENDLRSTFHARWIVENPPAANVISTALELRQRRRSLVRSLSLGGAFLFTVLVVSLVAFLPATIPPQAAATATSAATAAADQAASATPTEDSHTQRPVNRRDLLAAVYPGKLAFVAFSELSDHLFTFQPGTRDYQKFTAGFAEDSAPAWSPDGRLVAYLSQPEGKGANDVYVANADGTGIREMPMPIFSQWLAPTQTPSGVAEENYPHYGPPQWSPDGEKLAMGVWAGAGRHFLVVRSIRDDAVQGLLPVKGIDLNFVAWSPDGRAIAYVTNDEKEIHIWQPDLPVKAGENPRLLYLDDAWDDVFGLAWSPDSSQVAVLGGIREYDVMQVDLYFINMQGESLEQMPISAGILTRIPKRLSNLAWSPDGRYLGFIPVFTNKDLVYGRILLIPTGGKSPLAPLAEMEWDIGSFAWSPDGRWVAYSAGYEMWVASISAYESGQPPLARLSGSPGRGLNWQPQVKEQ